jgi:hypothetical protein
VQYALLQARLLELEVERCTSAEEFWPVFQNSLRRVGFLDPGEAQEEVIVQIKYNGSRPWTLHACAGRASHREWNRIAECFRPVYVKAVAKWRV